MSPFVRHYFEMVAAMFAGMFLLGPLTFMVLGMHGPAVVSPLLRTTLMILYMNIGMGAWMRYRGHSWERTGEMALGMTLPFFVLVPAMWAGLVSETVVNVAGHLGMFVTMWGAMILRRAEYSMDHSQHAHMHH